LVNSQFRYAADTSFDAAATATYREALVQNGLSAAALVAERFRARGITVTTQ
jgi:hypothetical protein